MLSWLNDFSTSLNPDDEKSLQEFKNIQEQVRHKKLLYENNLDQLKITTERCQREVKDFLQNDMVSFCKRVDEIRLDDGLELEILIDKYC